MKLRVKEQKTLPGIMGDGGMNPVGRRQGDCAARRRRAGENGR